MDQQIKFVGNERAAEIIGDMVEIALPSSNSFHIIRETLRRIGIQANETKALTQQCYLLHKRGRYYIGHYKQFEEMEGKEPSMTTFDYLIQRQAASLLERWGCCTLVNEEERMLKGDGLRLCVVPKAKEYMWRLISPVRVGR